jgi:peptidoglycan hydrolase CwlO-like protein
MSFLLIFLLMMTIVSTCTFFYIIGNRARNKGLSTVLDSIREQSQGIEHQIGTLSANVHLLCETVSQLKEENVELQHQITELSNNIKLIGQ